MYILSFRDMSVPRYAGVTSAAVYALDNVGPAFAWTPAALARRRLVGSDELGKALNGKHVCFLLHGFNVDRDNGSADLGALAQEMTGNGPLPGAAGLTNYFVAGVDVVVSVLWAGDWYLPINYPFLLPDIRQTGANFAAFLGTRRVAKASFVSHSMGARVILETVQQASNAASARTMPIFDTAVLTAAAASDDILDSPYYARAVAALQRIVIVSSAKDSVLSGDFPAGNLAEQALWSNDVGSLRALGLTGPKLKKDSAALGKVEWYDIASAPKGGGYDHSDYLPAPLVAMPPPAYPNGWTDKRERVAGLIQALFDGTEPSWPRHMTVRTTP